jgi:hypothetical protein
MADEESTFKDEITTPADRTHVDVLKRNKWARIRQDTLMDWAQIEGPISTAREDELIRIRFGARSTATVRRRWATCTREDLIAWLKEQDEEPLPAISAQARRFFKASDIAAVRLDRDGARIAVYVGTPPDFVKGPYDPGSDDPWTKNLLAVWMKDGEPDSEPEGL